MDTLSAIERQIKNFSYICARDPSIITVGGPIPENLNDQFGKKTENFNNEIEQESTLQVYLRIKNGDNFNGLYQIRESKSLHCIVPPGAHCIRNVRDGTTITKVFDFSNIFGPDSTQSDVFNNVVKVKVLRFMNGLNSSLLTYGASGSGKTFTIIGTADQPGIVPRALEYMFRTLPKLPEQPQFKPTVGGGIKKLSEMERKNTRFECQNLIHTSIPSLERSQHSRTYRAMQERLSAEPVASITENIGHVNLSIWVSFAEIYNEYVFDLLKNESVRGLQRQKLRVGYCNGSAYIKDLTYINVASGVEAYHIVQYGLSNLNFASTTINDHSSRSHSIFTIKLIQTSELQDGFSVSSFNFCDLAGSERIKKTNHVGERLKESNNINTSLLTLGRCVNLVRESQKRNENIPIPFRESKLTQLFQRALQGFESISMIVNINPVRDMFDETQHVLNFSAIAKGVITEKQQIVIEQPLKRKRTSTAPSTNQLSNSQQHSLLAKIEELYEQLDQQELEHDENCQRIINTYKDIIEQNDARWEARYNKLQDELLKLKWSDVNGEPQNKKRKTSIINLDSSSEENSPMKTNDNEKILKSNLAAKDTELELLKKEAEGLQSENLMLKDQLQELNDYVNAIQKVRLEDIDEEKENM